MLLFAASGRVVSFRTLLENGLKRGISMVAIIACLLPLLIFLNINVLTKVVVVIAILILFYLTSWRYVLDIGERKLITSAAYDFAGIMKGIK